MLLLALLAAALLGLTHPTSTAAARKTSFIIFFVDDMGIDQIEVPQRSETSATPGNTGNNGTIKTPNIKTLAEEGLVFQCWYSGFHLCSPSRAAMLTGRLPIRSGIGSPTTVYAPHAPGPSDGGSRVFTAESIGGLPRNESTIAERLKPLGYATMAIGKWRKPARNDGTLPFTCDLPGILFLTHCCL